MQIKIKKIIIILIMLMCMAITTTGCKLISNLDSNDVETIEEKSLTQTQKEKIESAIKHYFYGMETADLNYFLSAFPQFMQDNYNQQMLNTTLESFKQQYGDNIHISYQLLTQKEVEKQEIEIMQKYIEVLYDSKDQITAGYIIGLTATIQGNKSSDTDELDFYVFEINGDWYYLEETPESAAYYL